MSMFKQETKSLTDGLSQHQINVARQNYRVAMGQLSQYMDVTSANIKAIVSAGVIERIKAYEME